MPAWSQQPAVPFPICDDPRGAGILAAVTAAGEAEAGPGVPSAIRKTSPTTGVRGPPDRGAVWICTAIRRAGVSVRHGAGRDRRPGLLAGSWEADRGLSAGCGCPGGPGWFGDQQAPRPASEDAADDVEVIELDAGLAARRQTGHLPGADDEAALASIRRSFAGLRDAANVGAGQPQGSTSMEIFFQAAALPPRAGDLRASSMWLAWT